MLIKYNFLQISCLLFLILFSFSNCQAQNEENKNIVPRTSAGSSIPHPIDEARIEIIIPEYELEEINLDYLLTLSVPTIKFVFDQKQLIIEPTNEIKEVINAHWQEGIKFFYEEKYNKQPTAQEAANKDIAWLNFCLETERKLQNMTIEATNGKRNVSQTESSEIMANLNRAAVGIIKKIEEK